MLAAVVIWASCTLLLKRRSADLPPTVTLAARMVIGTGLMLPLALFCLPFAHLAITPGFLGAMAYIVVLPSVLAFWF